MDVLENTTFTKCRSLVSRPLEINFSDGKGTQRIEPLSSTFFVDEVRLVNDDLALAQFNGYVANKKVRVLEKGVTL